MAMYDSLSSLLHGFSQEVDDYVANMEDADLGVGNGVPVTFDEWVSEKHKINRAGRMTLTAGEREYHAAPTTFDRDPVTKVEVSDYTSEVLRFASGRSFSFVGERPSPKSSTTLQPTGVPHRYEPQVLTELCNKYDTVTLVNPALATIWRCEHKRNIVVLLTDRTPKYEREINDITDGWRPSRRFDFVDAVQCVAYVGSNGPRQRLNPSVAQVLNGFEWVALTPNPFQISFPYENFSLVREEASTAMTYERKGRMVVTILDDFPEHYRFNPYQVDAAYRSSGKDDKKKHGSKLRYYLETNVPDLQIPAHEDSTGPPIGRLPLFPPFFGGVSSDQRYLYDAEPCIGTYVSRRHILRDKARDMGKELVPLLTSGTHMVTINTQGPVMGVFQSVFVHNGSRYVCCSGDYDMSDVPLTGEFVGYLYSTVINVGVTAAPFFEGSYVEIPFDPVSKRFYYNPPAPGLYFFFPSLSTMHAYQIPVLQELYGCTFRPPCTPYVPLDYETSDVSAYVHGVLAEVPLASRVGEGGISIDELSRMSQVSKLFLRDVLPTYSGVLMFSKRGVPYVQSMERVVEEFLTPRGLKRMVDIWTDWVMGHPIDLLPESVDRFREAMNVVGRPVVNSVEHTSYITVKGMVIRNFAYRDVEFTRYRKMAPINDDSGIIMW